jgi:Uma2 family endonuclease
VTERDLGEVILSPMDVRLDENIVVQPDLFFVGKDSPVELQLMGWATGSPDLAIEVLSSSNPEHDLVRKRELYARYRIPEYWILSPLERTLTVLTLKDGIYVELRPTEGVASSEVLPGFTLDIDAFYEAVYS